MNGYNFRYSKYMYGSCFHLAKYMNGPREDAGGLSLEYVLPIPSVS